MNVCKALCGECPFSNTSLRGFLGDYSIEDIREFFDKEVLFPCHMSLKGFDTKSVTIINQEVFAGKWPLCRGYIEMMAKSCKSPRNTELRLIVEECKLNLSENSMSIWDFVKHHNPDFKQKTVNNNT